MAERFDAGDAESVKERNTKIKSMAAVHKAGLRAILENPSSRAYLWELLSFCGVFRTSMTGNSYTYYNEGIRAVGLRMLADVKNVDPKFLIQMMTENGGSNESTNA